MEEKLRSVSGRAVDCSCPVSVTTMRAIKSHEGCHVRKLGDAFTDGWSVESIEPARFEVRPVLNGLKFLSEWLERVVRSVWDGSMAPQRAFTTSYSIRTNPVSNACVPMSRSFTSASTPDANGNPR